jgi:ribosomal protein L25 (general stress protein Ctc)
LGTSWTDSTQVARESIRGALENVNQGLKEAGKSQLKIDSTEIEKALKDPTALRELTAKITKGEQELATAQKAQLDPVTQSNQYF